MKTTIAHKVMKNSPKVTKRVSSTLDFLILFDHAKSMEETMNTYAYCKNNPIMNIDPNGEFFAEIFGSIFPGLGHLIGGALDAVAANNIARTGFNFSKWEFDEKVFYSSLASGALGMFNIKLDTGSGFFNDWVDESVNSGLGSLATTGNFDKGFKRGVHDYLVNRVLDGASMQLPWYDYNLGGLNVEGLNWGTLRNGLDFINNEGYVIAHGGVLGVFEHWHVITKDADFAHLGYHFLEDIGGFGEYKATHFSNLKNDKKDTKFRVVKALKNVNKPKAEQGAYWYDVLWNNCVHAAKSQIRNKTNYRSY